MLIGKAAEQAAKAWERGKGRMAERKGGGGEEEAGKRKGPSWLRPAGQQGPAVATLLPGSRCL